MSWQIGSRSLKLSALLAIALLGLSGLSAPAIADGPQGSDARSDKLGSALKKMESNYDSAHVSKSNPRSDVMGVVADKVYETGNADGLARITMSEKTKRVVVLWKGRVPRQALSLSVKASPLGVKVVHKSGAKFSRKTVQDGVEALQRSGLVKKLKIMGVDVADDYSKVTIKLAGKKKPSKADRAKVSKLLRVPIKYSYGHKQAPLFANRQNDSKPWKGGAKMVVRGNGCSTGFAVLTRSGYGRLLSARHCDPSGKGTVRDGGGTVIARGSGVKVKRSIDSMLIDPIASPATTPRVYRGGVRSGRTSKVRNWSSNWPGNYVCSSGAYTGERCGYVYDDDDYHNVSGQLVNVIQVKGARGRIMGGTGDSGGPIFKKLSNGVQARGILLGPDLDKPIIYGASKCPGYSDICSKYIDYVPVSTILRKWNVRLEVR